MSMRLRESGVPMIGSWHEPELPHKQNCHERVVRGGWMHWQAVLAGPGPSPKSTKVNLSLFGHQFSCHWPGPAGTMDSPRTPRVPFINRTWYSNAMCRRLHRTENLNFTHLIFLNPELRSSGLGSFFQRELQCSGSSSHPGFPVINIFALKN